MARSIHLSLTDELREFLDRNSGDGTLFSTPSEFVRAIIREKKERQEAAALRAAVVEGYGDIRDGRTHVYTGDLKGMLATYRSRRRKR